MSRRSTLEYSGFLKFVWRNDHSPFDIVDLTELKVASRRENGELRPPSLTGTLALLHPHEIIEHKLWDNAQPFGAEEREKYENVWTKLRAENAALRVLDPDLNLESAPISYFDERLVACAKRDWQKAGMIIGEVLADFLDEPRRFQTNDLVLMSRIRALVESKALEGKGDLAEIRTASIRLSGGAAEATGE